MYIFNISVQAYMCQGDISIERYERYTKRDQVPIRPRSRVKVTQHCSEQAKNWDDHSVDESAGDCRMCLCLCVTSIPVSVVGNKHPLSDLPFNFLVNNQQHDSIEVESFTLSKKTQLPPLHIYIYSYWSGKLMARHEKCFYCYKNETDLHSYCLPKAVSHPHLEAQSLGSAEYKHLHVGHPNICSEDKIKCNTLL